jgi:hypothetical protein
MRTETQQLWYERQKSIRAAIRLKYSLMADAEINRVMDLEKKKFWKMVQQGVRPAPVKVLNG